MDPDTGNRHHRQLTNGQDTWRARYAETHTPGSEGGPGKRTGGNTSTAPGAYLTAQLAGVGQCAAHLIRHAKGVLELHPTQQQWAEEVITVLCEAAAAVTAAQADGRDHLDPELLAQLRRRYDHAVSWGITTNRHRD